MRAVVDESLVGSHLYGKHVLFVAQCHVAYLVERLWQYDATVIFLAHLNLLTVKHQSAKQRAAYYLSATQLVRLYDIKAIGDTNKYLPVVCQERRSLVVRSRQQSVAVVVVSYIHLPLSVVVFEQYQRHTIFRSHPNIFIVVFYH